jgi:hypothetical protein
MNHPAGDAPSASPSGGSRGWAAALLNTAVFLIAVAGGCAAIHVTRPFPKVHGVYEKYLHLMTHSADYEVLFVGSSRLYRAIIPHRFEERVTAATGQKVPAFNLAFDAMTAPESYFFLREILALKPRGLRWVFLEAAPMETWIYDSRPPVRYVYWHDLRHTRLILQAIGDESLSIREKAQRAIGHAAFALTSLTNADRGTQWLRPELGLEKPEKRSRVPKEWAQTAGYAQLTEARLLTDKKLSRYLQKVRRRAPGPPLAVPAFWREELESIVKEVRAAGAQVILINTPSVLGRENYRGYPDHVPVFRFQDPGEFPELFDPAHHWDQGHLNHEGAEVLTDLISARFIELLRTPARSAGP